MSRSEDSEVAIVCVCGSKYTHFADSAVVAYARDCEDSNSGVVGEINIRHGVVSGRRVTVSDDYMLSNPSKRRSAVVLHFICEMCRRVSAVRLAQHEGVTFVEPVGCSFGLWP